MLRFACLMLAVVPLASRAETDLLVASSVRVAAFASNGITQHGSGTVIRKDKKSFRVLTCSHVIRDGATRYTVTTVDGKQYACQVLIHSVTCDLALLESTAPASEAVQSVKLADKGWKYHAGRTVTKVGYPRAGPRVIRSGKVLPFVSGSTTHPDVVSTVASVEAISGDSGGGLFNDKKELVGVVWGSLNGQLRASRLKDIYWFLDQQKD